MNEYNKLETNDPRADSMEGVLNRTLDEEEFRIKPNDIRFPHLSSGDIFIKSMNNMQGIIRNRLNCHIFCMTQLQPSQSNLIKDHKEHFKVSSYWEINDVKIGSFVNYLAGLYRDSITVNDFIPESQKIIGKNFLDINLEVHVHPIKYVHDKNISVRDYSSDFFNRIVFHKSDKFENEQEFRIAFIIKNNNEILHIKDNPKIVNIIPGGITDSTHS